MGRVVVGMVLVMVFGGIVGACENIESGGFQAIIEETCGLSLECGVSPAALMSSAVPFLGLSDQNGSVFEGVPRVDRCQHRCWREQQACYLACKNPGGALNCEILCDTLYFTCMWNCGLLSDSSKS